MPYILGFHEFCFCNIPLPVPVAISVRLRKIRMFNKIQQNLNGLTFISCSLYIFFMDQKEYFLYIILTWGHGIMEGTTSKSSPVTAAGKRKHGETLIIS